MVYTTESIYISDAFCSGIKRQRKQNTGAEYACFGGNYGRNKTLFWQIGRITAYAGNAYRHAAAYRFAGICSKQIVQEKRNGGQTNEA